MIARCPRGCSMHPSYKTCPEHDLATKLIPIGPRGYPCAICRAPTPNLLCRACVPPHPPRPNLDQPHTHRLLCCLINHTTIMTHPRNLARDMFATMFRIEIVSALIARRN